MRHSKLVSATLACLGGFIAPLLAEVKIEEEILGPYNERGNGPTFSPTGLHVAIITPKGSRTVVMVDGVEGPRVDQVQQGTIVFSDDGRRHAYTAVVGTDAIVVLDGKEVARSPMHQNSVQFSDLKFSPQGKRFFYQQLEDLGAYRRLVVDGQAGARYQGIQDLVFSPDGTRFAHLATKDYADQSKGMNLIVDGKDVGFQGEAPQFSPDGQTVVTVGHTQAESVLLLNGKPGSKAKSIRGVHMSKGGVNLLVIGKMSRDGKGTPGEFLGAGGKIIPGTECERIEWVKFSPDGKRYAALCSTIPVKYLVIDGKKGENYSDITEFQFSPDSTRTTFWGRTNVGTFLVVDGEEYENSPQPVFGGGGRRVGFIRTIPMSRTADVVIDGKIAKFQNVRGLGFSPDGNRYAFGAGDPMFSTLYVDGVEQKGVGVIEAISGPENARLFTFSPDGKRLAHHGFIGAREKLGLILDGKLLGPMGQLYRPPIFTPDSQHVVCFSQNPGNGRAMALLVDGQPAVIFDFLPYQNPNVVQNIFPAEMGDDGVFTFVGASEGVFKRFRVHP